MKYFLQRTSDLVLISKPCARFGRMVPFCFPLKNARNERPLSRPLSSPIDPETKEPHIYNHRVNEDEVEDVLRESREDRPGREGSRVTIGQTQNGRYLRVIYVPDPVPYSIFVITAYDLSGKSLKAYKRRRRKKLK